MTTNINSCLNIFLIIRLARIKIWNNIYHTIWVPKQIQILILDWKTSSILASIHWKPTTSYAWTRKSYILALVGRVFDIRLQMEDSIWMPRHFLVNLCRTQSILRSKFYCEICWRLWQLRLYIYIYIYIYSKGPKKI